MCNFSKKKRIRHQSKLLNVKNKSDNEGIEKVKDSCRNEKSTFKTKSSKINCVSNISLELTENVETSEQNCISTLKSTESKAENTVHPIQVPETALKRSLNEEASSQVTKRVKFEDKEICESEKSVLKTKSAKKICGNEKSVLKIKSAKKYKLMSIKDMFANQKQKL